MNKHLPFEYNSRIENTSYVDIPSNIIFQPNVYKLANFLADRSGVKTIIDIGCGSGEKLKAFEHRFDIIGIDCLTDSGFFTKFLPGAKLIEFNLENGLPDIEHKVLRSAVVICSDVIEHLKYPEHLLVQLANISRVSPFVLISTPDRDRARGWLDNGPPANPAHSMEWSANEFARFARTCGFEELELVGHTINTDKQCAKITTVLIAGQYALTPKPSANIKVAAIIHTYNELDILEEVVEHLISQGVEVHIFDNWSTDSTWDLLMHLKHVGKVNNIARFPDVPTESYQWHSQLQKTSDYALELDADWIMHYDADEFRVSPWRGVTLQAAISKVDELGFNAIDFTVIDFRFLSGKAPVYSSFQNELTHFEFGRRQGHFLQVKCWKNNCKVNLAESGGHSVSFDNRKIFPLKFLLKHYSLRNEAQANKKVFRDRLPRFTYEQEKFGWHTHYNSFNQEHAIKGWDRQVLIPWHPIYSMSEYIVERLSGIGLDN